MRRRFVQLNPTEGKTSLPLPGLRPGVVLVGHGDDGELRDVQLGQVVKLGEVASVIVGLLDGTRDAEALLRDAARILGEELNPLGLVELLQALDRRALLDTPRARMVVAQGLVRADIAALQRLARRRKQLTDRPPVPITDAPGVPLPFTSPGAGFACKSCNRCCSEDHLLGPVTREERDRILMAFAKADDDRGSDPSNFIPLPTAGSDPVYLLRPRDGFCSYLGEDGLCRVHKLLGEDAKPAICRLFPYRAIKTPSGWDVGMSLLCPTVADADGPDPAPDARRTIQALQVITPHLRQAPDKVDLIDGLSIEWTRYEAWERELLDGIHAGGDVRAAWLAGLRAFEALIDVARDEEDDDDDDLGAPMETEESLMSADSIDETIELAEPAAAVDRLFCDLALWSELLVGLEAADPMALRRFRSAMLRLRGDLAYAPEAAPVLAELARLKARGLQGDGLAKPEQDTQENFPIQVGTLSADELKAELAGDDRQRRFLSEALAGKRPFEYGTVARGLLAISVFLAVLRLQPVDNDEHQPRLSDIAYLVNHPQLTDIMDTRAVVRSRAAETVVHALVLGVRP